MADPTRAAQDRREFLKRRREQRRARVEAFAAAALSGVLADNSNWSLAPEAIAAHAWRLALAMERERDRLLKEAAAAAFAKDHDAEALQASAHGGEVPSDEEVTP